MLVIEIAVGVFVGGIALWLFTSYLERKKQAQILERKITLLFESADSWVKERFEALTPKYLDVFRERLTTIYDDPDHTPLVCAQAEFNIFIKNSDELKSLVTADCQEALKENLLMADEVGVRARVNEHIDRLIASAILDLHNNGMSLYCNTLLGKDKDTSLPVTQEQISDSKGE